MANYNREILVPYLRDVCSVELLCQKLERDANAWQNRINNCKSNLERGIISIDKPRILSYIWGPLLIAIFGCASLLFTYLDLTHPNGLSLGRLFRIIFFGSMSGLFFYFAIKEGKEDFDAYRWDLHDYQRTLDQNERINQEYAGYASRLKHAEQNIDVVKRQLYNARNLRQQVYGVNIIPKQYRNVYAAYYLYDYFSTSRETDLDRVIQTLLLDEIKQRLDKIISQMEEMILNQRYQTALQEKQNAMIASNHREQMNRIARMERNQELQMDYQNMIAQNQNVTNFILTLDYLQKY